MTTTAAYSYDPLPQQFTGKERDAETGLDYFGARYLSSAQGRWMSPDWSEEPQPVPYADPKDPQSLNLYGYVRNNPLKAPDQDGHEVGLCYFCGPGGATLSPVETNNPGAMQTQLAANITKTAVGIGLIATAAVGDLPGGALGAFMVAGTALGGASALVSGTSGLIGQATNKDVKEAQEVLNATSNFPGLVVTAATGGNIKAGDVAATLGNAVSLAVAPKEAVKNLATAADAAQTVKDTGGLIQKTLTAVINFINPAPPPAPKPPSTPGCSGTGACPK